MSRTFALALTLATLSLSACGGARAVALRPPEGTPRELSLEDDHGHGQLLPSRGARSTVLFVFSSKCEPCVKLVPAVLKKKSAIERHGGQLHLVAVTTDSETAATARAALVKWFVPTGFLVDRSDAIKAELDVEKAPASVVLDSAGYVRFKRQGGEAAKADELADELADAAAALE